MRILAVGGGSGGHVTPVVAVLSEIKKTQPNAEMRFWCDHAYSQQARKIMASYDSSLRVDVIVSGKLRRYNHLSVWQHITNVRGILIPNIVDSFKVIGGILQSIIKLIAWRPDVIFAKGGFVCIPVGIGAYILRIPLVIHDSDAHPGLTNRILSKFAVYIGTGAPLKFYNYSPTIARYVGVPVSDKFHIYSQSEKLAVKEKLEIDNTRPLVVVTGGGLGARRLNLAVANSIDKILENANVILISGKDLYQEMLDVFPANNQYFKLYDFVNEGMADILGASDVVVARAGATTILELATLAKPTILVPNAYLTGGHQLKNANVYAENGAVLVAGEDDLENNPDKLPEMLRSLLGDDKKMESMARAFHEYARPRSAKDMAEMIINATK